MSWADGAIESLNVGESVYIWPKGNSMHPKVKSGARVTLDPITDPAALKKGDIVLVTVKGRTYLHLIKAVQGNGERFLIGNNRGGTNGWTNASHVHGVATEIING